MNPVFRRIVIYVLVSQIILIVIVISAISKKAQSPIMSISPLNSQYLVFNPQPNLKYFYEPKPNSVWKIGDAFLKELGYPAGFKVNYAINEDGFNQKAKYSLGKPSGIYRIITIGDSFTFGDNVNPDKNYPSQLENILNKNCTNKFQIINLGVSGYDIQYSVERFKLRGQKYNPDLVLWFIISGDFIRISDKQILKSTLMHKQIVDTQGYLAGLSDNMSHASWKKAADQIINELGGQGNVLKLQAKYLRLMNSYYNKKLVTFTLSDTPNNYKNILSDFAKTRPGILFLPDIPTIYNNHDYYLNDAHPSAEGYSLIVENLFEYLTKNKIIPCKN